ncbi:MAG: hypothetical protein AB7T49_13360 [Oligoflexales bacterium]
MRTLVKILAFALGSTSAFAGGWASGGAKHSENSLNPWFIQNTTVVRYCVISDSQNFSLELETAQQLIRKAITHWQEYFKKVQSLSVMDEDLKVGSQDFVYEACSNDTDIVFQLGVLTSNAQRKFLDGSPGDYAAISVRTNYDSKLLKGKGFVYFSPESGPDKYIGSKGSQSFWSDNDGLRFLLIAIHELGHVFGIPHVDFATGKKEHVMSTSITDAVISPEAGEISLESFTYDIHISPSSIDERSCGRRSSDVIQFLGAEVHDCFEFRYENKKINIYEGNPASSKDLFGSIVLGESKEDLRPFNWLVLTPAQTVLQMPRRGYSSYAAPILMQRKTQYSGTYYKMGSSVGKPVILTIDDAFQTVELDGITTDKGLIELFRN